MDIIKKEVFTFEGSVKYYPTEEEALKDKEKFELERIYNEAFRKIFRKEDHDSIDEKDYKYSIRDFRGLKYYIKKNLENFKLLFKELENYEVNK